MSADGHGLYPRGDGGIDTSDPSHSVSSSGPDSAAETMKRAAAKQLIEKYYFQLTDGCGDSKCENSLCASSPAFTHRGLSSNQAALRAIELFKSKAVLCEPGGAAKIARGGETTDSHQGTSGVAGTSRSGRQASPSVIPPPSRVESCSSFHTAQVEATIPYLTEDKLHQIIETCRTENNWSELIKSIWAVFSDTQSLLKSFRKDLTRPSASKEDLQSTGTDLDKDQDAMETAQLEETPVGGGDETVAEMDGGDDKEAVESPVSQDSSTSATPGTSSDYKSSLNEDEITLDLKSLRRAYTELFAIPDHPFQSSLLNALRTLANNLEMELKHKQAYEHDNNYLNIVFIVMEIPLLHSPEYIDQATSLLCKALGHLPLAAQVKLARIWSTFPACCLKDMVSSLQQLITVTVLTTEWSRVHWVHDSEGITGAARIMKILYYASMLGGELDSACQVKEETDMHAALEDNLQDLFPGAIGHEPKERRETRVDPMEKELNVRPLDCRRPLVDWEDFVNEPLSDNVEMDKDYTNYKTEEENRFSFMRHSFLLTTAVKNMGLYFDNRIRMINERRASQIQSIFHAAPSTPYLRLRIRRDHVIDDALVSLEMAAMDNPQDLKKQLYVEFEGEQGIDEGGVSKEFFQLVVEALFNPDIGMFTYDEETLFFWFNPTSFENDGQFTLIGIMLGLAIYNSIILDVHFPMVVYRKLMGKKGTFEDLKDSHPTLARGLQGMLDFQGDVGETFMQTFSISFRDVFGDVIHHELKENGQTTIVDNSNRKEFVDLYADYLLNTAVEKQFKAFLRGFTMVTDESPLKMLFRPEEIELLVCGSKQFDFFALETATEYDGGFQAASPTIKAFWEIVHEFTEEQKRQLLQFTTGSDRVPVGGLSKLKLIIAKNGPDSDRLPTSHTCFNVLLLPDYSSKAKLTERLLKAITHAKGFGML